MDLLFFSIIMCVNCFDVDDEILIDILNNCGKYQRIIFDDCLKI